MQYMFQTFDEKTPPLSDNSEKEIFKIMQNINISKDAGIDHLYEKFLKDGAKILAKLKGEI